MHNQFRQDNLELGKQWITYDGMIKGLLGMTIVDVYKLGQFHGLLPRGTCMLYYFLKMIYQQVHVLLTLITRTFLKVIMNHLLGQLHLVLAE